MQKSFFVRTEIIVNRNLAEAVLRILVTEESKRVLVFTDVHVIDHQQVSRMIEEISGTRKVELIEIPSGEPTTDMVNTFTEKYQDWDADMLIAIGGGSVIDFVKALSGMLVYKDRVDDWQANAKPYEKAIKKIAVSTTAGTGAEISKYGVLINPHTKFKRGVVGPCVSPEYAIVCAELGCSVPREVTAACGMDALAHAMESYVSTLATPVSKLFSREAFISLYKALPLVVNDLNNIDLREEMLYASALAGCAITNANTGACHGMSYAPGVFFGVPHGVAISVFFSESILLNIEKGSIKGYADLYEALGNERSGDDEKDARKFYELMCEYMPISICKTLMDYGVNQSDMELLASFAMGNTAAFVTNPVQIIVDDAYRIYRKALKMD
jgi:alcohol dehydrogenase class IV